jgi:acyl-coenzyme A thioesterase PaaI-like protein
VHGGWVATLLDHLMGYAAGTVGQWIYTRSLTVDYDHAVPLFEELEITARVDEVEGRKIWVIGEIRAAGSVVARARGLWLPPRIIPEAAKGYLAEVFAPPILPHERRSPS